MTGIGPTLIDELTQLVQRHATAQHYQFAGGISIKLVEDPGLSQGMIRIDSTNVKGTVTWTPVLDAAGKRYPITKSRTIIGRGSDADITIDDTGISRKHVEILWDGERAEVNDLGSTNGSQLNGAARETGPPAPGIRDHHRKNPYCFPSARTIVDDRSIHRRAPRRATGRRREGTS